MRTQCPPSPGAGQCHPCFTHNEGCGGRSHRPEGGGHVEFGGDTPPKRQGERGPGPEGTLPAVACGLSPAPASLQGLCFRQHPLPVHTDRLPAAPHRAEEAVPGHVGRWAAPRPGRPLGGQRPAGAPVRRSPTPTCFWFPQGLSPPSRLPPRSPGVPSPRAPRCRARRSQARGALRWPLDLRSDSNNRQTLVSPAAGSPGPANGTPTIPTPFPRGN